MAVRQIKIGTYNVNNLYDRFDDPYNTGDDHWGPRGTSPKNLSDLFSIGARLREDKPDILALQEVENKGAVSDFNVAHLGGHFRDFVVVDGNDPRGIQVGLGSTLPIGHVVSYQFLRDYGEKSKPKLFSRDLLEVEILDPDSYIPIFTVFVTHLKSKFVDPALKGDAATKEAARSTHKRTRQAMAIGQIIKRRFSDLRSALYVLMGDFNDTPDSTALSYLLRDPDLGLYDVLSPLATEKRWTHYWSKEKQYSQLDYVLLSPAMATRVVAGSAHVVQRGHSTGSDHRPVYVDLQVGWE
jgi:endonuclease/exonuclease/phosphatase family metal-dependent hydrolase